MTLKDVTAHRQGRRHIAASAKIGEALGVEGGSDCFKAEASTAKDTSAKAGNAQVVAAATSSQTSTRKLKSSAPPCSSAMGSKEGNTSSKPFRGAQKGKGKTTLEPKSTIKKIFPPPIAANLVDAQLDTEYTGWFMDSFPSDTYIDNPDYSICDKDCGWCGRCMNDMALE